MTNNDRNVSVPNEMREVVINEDKFGSTMFQNVRDFRGCEASVYRCDDSTSGKNAKVSICPESFIIVRCNEMGVIPAIKGLSYFCVRCVKRVIQ